MILFCSAECKSSIDSRFLGKRLDRLLFSVQPTLLKSRSDWTEVAGYIYPKSTWAQGFFINSFHPDLTWPAGWQSAGQVRVQVILSNSGYTRNLMFWSKACFQGYLMAIFLSPRWDFNSRRIQYWRSTSWPRLHRETKIYDNI